MRTKLFLQLECEEMTTVLGHIVLMTVDCDPGRGPDS